MKIRVYYEDTDAGGIVYHANYLKFCERARSELFFSRGVKPFEEDQSGFVVRKVEAEFLGMARLGDLLEVRTRLLEQSRSTIRLLQSVYREDEIVYEMEVLLVYVVRGRPKRIPAGLMELIEAWQRESAAQ